MNRLIMDLQVFRSFFATVISILILTILVRCTFIVLDIMNTTSFYSVAEVLGITSWNIALLLVMYNLYSYAVNYISGMMYERRDPNESNYRGIDRFIIVTNTLTYTVLFSSLSIYLFNTIMDILRDDTALFHEVWTIWMIYIAEVAILFLLIIVKVNFINTIVKKREFYGRN